MKTRPCPWHRHLACGPGGTGILPVNPVVRASCLILCAAAILLTCHCQPDSDRLVYRHMSNHQRDEARQRWDTVRGGVKLQLAQQHLDAGRVDEAETAFEQAVALTPDNPRAYLLAARLRLEQGRLAEAREAVALASSLSDGDPEITYFAGIIAERYGDPQAALLHYSDAATRAPNVAAYVLARAETLVALDRPAEALETLTSRMNDFDGNIPMRMLAAQINRILGLRGPVVDHCRQALRARDDDPTLRAEIGLLFTWAEQYAEAITLLRPLVEAQRANRYYGTGILPVDSRGTGILPVRATGGVSARASAERAGPVAPAVARALARAYLATGQCREAQWALKPIIVGTDGDAVALCLYTRAALALNDLDAAAEAITRAQQGNPPTPEMLLLAAYVALQRGDDAGALDAAEAALKLDERRPVPRQTGLPAAHWIVGRAAAATGPCGTGILPVAPRRRETSEKARRAHARALALDPSARATRALPNAAQRAATPKGADGPEILRRTEARAEPRRPTNMEGMDQP